MPLKRHQGKLGTFVVLEQTSKILKGAPLGAPHLRKPSFLDNFFDAKSEGARSFLRNRKDRLPQKRRLFK